MLEENEQQPTSNQRTSLGEHSRPQSFQAFLPVDDFIPEDFRDFFSRSARLFPFSTDFNDKITTDGSPVAQQQKRYAVLSQYQHNVYSLQKQARSPHRYSWSNVFRESHFALTEDELFDVVASEFSQCLSHQLDNASQTFIGQYENIAAFESEFLDLLIEVDICLRKVTLPMEELLKILRKTYEALRFVSNEHSPRQLGLLEYYVCVVGLREVLSPKQR